MSGPNWPVRRYEIIVKKGGAPLGLKLHQTKSRRGVYANGFAEGPYPPPGPQACMRVGDVLVSVDGKSVEGATLPVALAAIETARRRDRLRDFITAKQDDPRKGNVVMVFERVSPRLTFRDVALDPRKVVYLLNYMLEVRCAGTGGVGGSSSSNGGGDGKKEAVIISLDEARLMFWLEVQVLFEMSAVMAPSRDDMSKVYDKFFRPGSGFYVHELTDTRQAKIRTRRSWDGDVSGLPSVGRKAHPDPSAKIAKEVAQPQDEASSGSGSGMVVSTASTDSAASVSPGGGSGEGLGASTTASAAAGDGQEGKGGGGGRGGGGGGNIEAGEPPSSADPPPAPAARSSTEGGGSDVLAKHAAEAGENGTREGSGGTKPAVGAGDWVSLPVEFLAADLSKIFRASQEKVEETLTAGCFYRFKTSPWKGRMVAHLSNSPDFVHVPFERIMAEQELRDVMMLHMIITQTPGWLQVWREIELMVKPRMALLQTRRSVRHRRGSALSSRSSGTIRRHSASNDWERPLLSSMSSSSSSSSSNNINVRVGTSTPSLSRSSSFSPPSPDMRELKAAAALAIVASAVYLWDFFLSADSHASLGVARDTNAYVTLKQLLAENVPGDKMGGPGAGDASSGVGPGTQKGRDAGDDFAVSVGKALLDMQRHVLRKLCASVYPDFQASSSHEHLCAELTTGTRSPARLPPGPPDQLDFDPAPLQQQRDSVGGGAPLPPPPQGPTPAVRRGTASTVSPPRQVRAPPPLRQKMLLQQQQQQQQGGGSEVGAGDKASSASPFAFLGGGTPPSDGERKVVTAGDSYSHARRSSAPGVSPTGVASRGAGIGGKNGPGRVDPFPSEEDAPRVSDRAGRVQGVSGPPFEPLWRASRGWVLEKVMRRVELPPHVSKHRPPWDKACQQGRRGDKGAVGTGRSSSGTVPPDLRQHLSLPRTARRLGRRPSHSLGSLVLGEPTEGADSSVGVGGSTQGGDGGVTGDLDVASPPDILGSRSGFGVQETQGIEPGPKGPRENGGGGVVGEGIRGCAEWAVSFSGSLQQGIMTVQTEHAVCVAPRNLGLDVPPEGLEAFYCPCLPASGEAPRACPPPSGWKSSGVGKGGRGSGSNRGGCFGPGVPPPPPRLFTFAAPGRSGTGTFYGACLSVFRPVSQWVGGEPAADVVARGINRGSSNSPPPCPITTAATATATTTTAPDTQAPLVEEESKARIDGIMGDASSRTETASHVDAEAATAASVGEERAPPRLSGVGDVSGVLDGEVQAVDDRARGNMGDSKAPAEEVAIEKEGLGKLSADGGVSSAAGRETDSGVVEDAVLDDATEGRKSAAVDAAATAQKKKEASNTTILDKTPSMLEMLKLKKGMGIFGKSSSVGQNKVSPSPTLTAPMSSLPPSVTITEMAPDSDTEGLRVEVDSQGADEAPGGLEGSGGTGAVAKTKTTAAAAASPSILDLSSRFRLGMGMFGSGKASPRVVTGSGFSPKLGTEAAAATAAAAAATTSPAAGSAPVEASPTPSSSSGGVGKFSNYARRAGNFLGSDSRGVGRSPRPTQPPPSPDVLPNGPPPPSPLVPVYLSSPPPEAEDAVCGHGDATAVTAAVGAVGVATNGASRQLSDSAASEGGGRSMHKRTLSDVPPADAASAAAAAVMGANELASAASSGVGDASKGRSMSAASSGVGSSSSSSDSAPGARRQGESADGSGGNGRQKHTFFVASGVCLLSTRPEIGAMRRALAAYWAAHGEEILAKGSAIEGGAATAHAGGEGPAFAARESGGGGSGGSTDHGCSGSVGEVTETPSEGSGEAEDEKEQEEKKDVGAWTEMDPIKLRDVLVPFVTQERQEEKDRAGQAHRYGKERRRSAGAAQERTSSADVLTKSFSAGSLRHPGQSGGATHGQGDRAQEGETAEGGVDMSAVAHEDGSGFGLDFDPSVVFRCLSPRNLCLVTLALLCERKVVLVSSRLSLLTQAGEVFRSLLQPLSWSHVYVPLLPRKMAADLLQCPTPFILGLESVTARELELPRDAIQVHLDTDYLCVPKDFLGLAPMSVVCSRISSVLNPGVDDLDCPSRGGAGADAGGVWAAGTARIIRFLFREFISELLQGATESTFRVGQGSTSTILLDEHLYKRAKASAAKTAERFYEDQRRSAGRGGAGHGLHEKQYPGPLYNRHCGLLLDQFVKTQMLSHFLSEGGSE
ncbi:unnamed protein product [Ectocarpus sp. 4 AP-2014]